MRFIVLPLVGLLAACTSSDEIVAPQSGGSGGTGGEGAQAAGGEGGTGGEGGEGGGLACKPTTAIPLPTAPCEAHAEAFCKKLETCEPKYLAVAYGSTAACETLWQSDCAALDALDGVAPNYAEERRACAKDYVNTACSCGYEDVCETVDKGLLANGQTCTRDYQCESLTCTATKTACGECVKPAAATESCDGLPCAAGLNCIPGINQCRKPLKEGVPCDLTEECEDRLVCLNEVCTQPLTAGAACNPDEGAEVVCDFHLGLYCAELENGSGRCDPYPFVNIGAQCGTDNGSGKLTQCKPNAYCSTPPSETGTCIARGELDDDCTSTDPSSANKADHTCLGHLYCPELKCVAIPPPSCE